VHGFRSTFRDCAAERAKFRNSLWSGSGIRLRIRRKPPTGTKSIEEAAPALGVAFGASSDPPLLGPIWGRVEIPPGWPASGKCEPRSGVEITRPGAIGLARADEVIE
jgi:hypothetical protein